jgi:hypothetical protein
LFLKPALWCTERRLVTAAILLNSEKHIADNNECQYGRK